MKVKERGYLHIFRNLLSAVDNEDVYGIFKGIPSNARFPSHKVPFTSHIYPAWF
jgi:hypothetical protein